MKLTWFGHSAFRLEIGRSVVMIDPYLSNPTFTGDHAAAYRGATHVVLTHGHDDHIGSTIEICEATGAMLVANFEICMYLGSKGVKNFSPGNHGGWVDYGDFSVAFVPAWHSSATIVDGVPIYMGNPAGVVITPASGGRPVYHMGDTDIFAGMDLIQEIYRPSVGLVPIGDRFTMGARTAAMACKRFFDFDVVIPTHYGTFPLLADSADAFISEMRGARAKVVVPDRGQVLEF